MKKVVAYLILTATLVSVLSGCVIISNSADETIVYSDISAENDPFFKAEIIEMSEKALVIKPLDEYSEARSSDKISIPNWFAKDSVKVGDIIGISYDGAILESYPAQLSKIFRMEYYNADGSAVTVIRFS